MKKTLLLFLSLFAFAGLSLAQVNTLTSELSFTSDPTFYYDEIGGGEPCFESLTFGCCGLKEGAHPYDLVNFTVDQADTYTFELTGITPGFTDFIGVIYDALFDPNDICLNYMEGDDDDGVGLFPEISITLTLVPGDYLLMSSTWATYPVGHGDFEYVWNVTGASGGNVYFKAPCQSDILVNNDPGVCGAVVDFTPPAGPPATLPGFTALDVFGAHTYYLSSGIFSGYGSYVNAIANGGFVTSINSAAENSFIRDAVTSVTGATSIWIGMNDVATEGIYMWQSGEPVVYTNWAGGEPNNWIGIEDYSIMLSDGMWNDYPNTGYDSYRYVLKLGSVVQTGGLASGSTFPVGTTTNEFLITEPDGSTSTCIFDVTVNDNEAPVVTCPAPSNPHQNVEGECMPMLDYSTTATDNCKVESIKYFINYDTPEVEEISFPMYFPVGSTDVTVVATDIHSNVNDECTFTVTVSQLETLETVTALPIPVQYSDLVDFCAKIEPDVCPYYGTSATSVTFFIDDDAFFVEGTETDLDPRELETVDLVAGEACMDPFALLDLTFEDDCDLLGMMAPGTKTVTAVFNGVNPNYNVENATTSLVIEPEDISVEYTGTAISGTTKVGNTQAYEVMLRAIVWDDLDDNTGDVRNAKVRFLNGTSPIITDDTDLDGWICVTLLNEFDVTEGMVELLWSGTINDDLEQFDITVEVGGYYEGSTPPYPLIVYVPDGEFITGGGHMILGDNVAGVYAATPGTKMNFGYNVKWNKKGTNLQGKMNIIYRVGFGPDKQVFQIKTNATNTMGIDHIEGTGEWAEFTSKANLKDVTDPLNPIDMGGNFTLHVTMTDKGEPGVEDQIAFTLYDGEPSALIFCSNWQLPNAVEQVIDGGNIVVYHDSGDGGNNGKGKGKAGFITADSDAAIKSLNIYPNPFSDRTFFEFTAATDSKAKLDIYDAVGRKLATLIDQNVTAGQEYRLEYQPGTIANGILFYTLVIDNEVKTGKLIHRR